MSHPFGKHKNCRQKHDSEGLGILTREKEFVFIFPSFEGFYFKEEECLEVVLRPTNRLYLLLPISSDGVTCKLYIDALCFIRKKNILDLSSSLDHFI